MAPTRSYEEIEGRSYKYAYSPVPESTSSTVYASTTLGKYPATVSIDEAKDLPQSDGTEGHCIAGNMSEKGSTVLQYVAAAAGNILTIATGAMLAWTSPILPKLKKSDPIADDNPLGVPIDDEQGSWIGSLVAVGAMFGCYVAGYMAEKWGRKRTLLFSVVPFTIGWILVATATSLPQLYVARLIFGLSLSFPFTVVPMYVGEIAETSVRGALGSFLQLFITIGLLYSYAIGPYVSYLVLWIACACLPILFFVCFMTMPESPYHLIRTGQREEAIASLSRLRSKPPTSVQKEADEIQAAIDEAFRNEVNFSDLFTVKANFKALLYTCALVTFQQLTGINMVLFYMEDIFISAGTDLPTPICTIIVAVVQIAASAVTPLIVDRLGRRILLVLSGIGTAVTCGALGLYFFLKDIQKSDVSSISWLPVISLVIFISTYSVGWGPLPWSVMGEMFAPTVKSKASGITVCVCWFGGFLITKFASNLKAAFNGLHTLFWLFGIACVVSVLFTVFILPETKGKSLQQIQDELNGVKPAISQFDDESITKK